MENQKYSSAGTSINSTKAPAIYSMPRAVDIMRGKTVLDIGGGKYDTAISKAAEYGANVTIYDPFNRTLEHNLNALWTNWSDFRHYDIAVISNVLNVIKEAENREEVLFLAKNRCEIILVSVYEGNGSGIGRASGDDSWQENRKTADYVAEIAGYLPEWDVKRYGKLIICTKKEENENE